MPNKKLLWVSISSALAWQTQAATITVNVATDESISDTYCTLREAVSSAQLDDARSSGCADGQGDDLISFDGSVFGSGATIVLESTIAASQNLTIDGQTNSVAIQPYLQRPALQLSGDYVVALSNLTIAGNPSARGAGITSSVDLTLDGVTIRDTGNTQFNEVGAAIYQNGGSLSLNDTTITGVHSGGGAIGVTRAGFSGSSVTFSDNTLEKRGALYVREPSSFQLTDCEFTGNSASDLGGGVYLRYIEASTTPTVSSIERCTFENNSAGVWAGALFSSVPLTMTDVTITGNTTGMVSGAVRMRSALTGTRVQFDSNVNGALFSDSEVTLNDAAFDATSEAPAIIASSATLDLTDTTFTNNTAVGKAGAIDGSNGTEMTLRRVTFQQNAGSQAGAVFSSGAFDGRDLSFVGNVADQPGADAGGLSHVSVNGPTPFLLHDSTFSGNTAAATGRLLAGAWSVYNVDLDVSNVSVTDNGADSDVVTSAGGIVVQSSTGQADGLTLIRNTGPTGGAWLNQSQLTMSNVTVTDNEALESCGGWWSQYSSASISVGQVSYNTALVNGGALCSTDGAAELDLERVTISRNSAGGLGGGLFSSHGTATLTNSTLSHNTAASGGAAYVQGGLDIMQSTVVDNRSTSGAALALVYASNSSGISFSNSIVANAGADCESDLPGLITTAGINHFFDDSCDGISSGDPMVAAVADNGGPTPTQHPRAGSPVIDAADQALCPDIDQRGQLRNLTRCDLGAVEVAVLNSPPRIEDQRLLKLAPVANGDLVGVVMFDDPDLPLPPGAASIIRGDPQFSLNPDGELRLDDPDPVLGDFELLVEVRDPGGLSDRAIVAADLQMALAPTIEDTQFDLPMDVVDGTVVGSVIAFDGNDDLLESGAFIILPGPSSERFSIDDVGVITLIDAADPPSSALLTVEVADQSGLTGRGEVLVRIGQRVFVSGFEFSDDG